MSFPSWFGLALDPSVTRPEPELLVGGAPARALRLRPAGMALVERWDSGAPVGEGVGPQGLARRLVDSGLAHPRPPREWAKMWPAPDVSIVVPSYRDQAALEATLGALERPRANPQVKVRELIVVDDCSEPPLACPQPGAKLLRRRANGGPGAARNSGWKAASSPLVAFLDSGCLPEPGWLDDLVALFADPKVGAVAPRVLAAPARTATESAARLVAYERQRSPLDMGPAEGLVGPGRAIPFVPAAALVVRREALEALGGFEESLRLGEDVDLVWRLVEAGWAVRYWPRSHVAHPMRPSTRALLAQRFSYGTSAAPLAARHGSAAAPAAVSVRSVAPLAAMALGPQPALAVAAALGLAASARPRVGSRTLAWRWSARAQLASAKGLATATRRAWLFALLPLGFWPPARRRAPLLAAAMAAEPIYEWARRRPGVGLVRWLALWFADDLAYQAGVWAGVARQRSPRALLPRLGTRRPSRGGGDRPGPPGSRPGPRTGPAPAPRG